MQRKDFYLVGILLLIAIVIFYPVIYTEYVYTDEVIQLWHYRKGNGFSMFNVQGRWVTEFLMSGLFGAISTIRELCYLRTFTLLLWLINIPVWYVVIKRVVGEKNGYAWLPFFTCLYLVTSLPFAVSVQWASCMEMPIGNTAALLSGAVLYGGIRNRQKWMDFPWPATIGSVALAMLSLFTYQSCFGCFLIPFLVHYISRYTSNKNSVLIKGLAFYLAMYALWYPLFRLTLIAGHISSDTRTGLSFNIFGKLLFFFTQPLTRAFWFNVIVNNHNMPARILCLVLLLGWTVLVYIRLGKPKGLQAVQYMAVVLGVLAVAYLPSLAVKENYSSNRTLTAIDLCVWIICVEMLLYFVKNRQVRTIVSVAGAALLVALGFYNFRYQFLKPVREEYVAVKDYLQQHYNLGIKTVYFIKPTEDAFQKKYHIQTSMDEFGVPSTFFDWVSEDFTRQIIFEKTGNRQAANALVIKYWPDMASFTASGQAVTANSLLVNVPVILQ